MFTIFGVASDNTETPLEYFDTFTSCRDWVNGYTAQGNYGGYEFIAIYSPRMALEATKDDT